MLIYDNSMFTEIHCTKRLLTSHNLFTNALMHVNFGAVHRQFRRTQTGVCLAELLTTLIKPVGTGLFIIQAQILLSACNI